MSAFLALSLPQTVAEDTNGAIPAATHLSLYSSTYADMDALLRKPGTNFASTVYDASRGAVAGLAKTGTPAAQLVNSVALAGLQVQAQQEALRTHSLRRLEAEHNKTQQAKEAASQRETQAKDLTHHNDNQKGGVGDGIWAALAYVASGGKSPMDSLFAQGSDVTREREPALAASESAPSIAAPSQGLGEMTSVSHADLGTGTAPLSTPVFAAAKSQGMTRVAA